MHNIAVLGAGIGGLASAIFLARDGHKVTVFEEFDTPRPIGSGLMLQLTGLTILEQLGLKDSILPFGTKITKLIGHTSPSNRQVLDVDLTKLSQKLFSLGIQRSSVFDLLFNTAKQEGVAFEFDAAVASACKDSGKIQFCNGRTSGAFDLIIDAMGAKSNLSSQPKTKLEFGALWATFDWPSDGPFKADALNQRYFRASKMVGVMPSGQISANAGMKSTFFWSIHENDYDAFQSASIDKWKADVIDLWPECENLLNQIQSHDDLTYAKYRHRTHKHGYEGRIAHVGDSWHATSPQLGQGANNALLDAYGLTLALRRTKDLNDALEDYAIMRTPHVQIFQSMSLWLTPLYQSNSKFAAWIRDWIIAPLSYIPPGPQIQAAMVTGGIMSPLHRLNLKPSL